MIKKSVELMGATAVVALIVQGCASPPPAVPMVGPASIKNQASVASGAVKVYSATEGKTVGDGPEYYPHTGYVICQPDGRQIKYVANHVGMMDESPMIVSLPAGTYLIRAQAEGYGRIEVPVSVKSNQVTELYLDGHASGGLNSRNEDKLVRMPNGLVVGWKAE